MNKNIKQLEIYWVNLDPTIGAETKKKRSCVIPQSDLFNESSKTVIVAPFLPDHKDWPFVVNVTPSKKNGLDKNRHLNIKQLRAIDVARIGNKQGYLENTYVDSIKDILNEVFEF